MPVLVVEKKKVKKRINHKEKRRYQNKRPSARACSFYYLLWPSGCLELRNRFINVWELTVLALYRLELYRTGKSTCYLQVSIRRYTKGKRQQHVNYKTH